jgi:hypothetical protein
MFQCIENHDLIDNNHTGNDRQPRVSLGDSTNARSWYARSQFGGHGVAPHRAGHSDDLHGSNFSKTNTGRMTGRCEPPDLVGGARRRGQNMSDHRFTRDLFWLRHKHPALRGEG